MKKISLLATSVAIALTGCGGGSGGSSDDNTTRDGVILTGFDGYFKNAVVFVDNNNNGQWDITTDTFLGLTDGRGQINVGSSKPQGTLALQTLTPGGTAQGKLISVDAEKYAGVYTVDMDLPGQPMEHELVFRAPNSSNVISPITDLVAIEVESGKSLEAAEEAVKEALTGQTDGDINLYSDYVDGAQADSKLHKTAQILTETKAANPSTYQDSATEIAKEADKAVEEIAQTNPELLDEDSFKPVVPVSGSGSVSPIPSDTIDNPSFKTTVNDDVHDAIQESLDSLDLELGMAGSTDYFIQLDLTGLFEDKDIQEIDLSYIKVDDSSLNGSNIQTVYSYDTQKLNIGVSPSESIIKAGEFEIIVEIGNSEHTNYTTAIFTLEVDEGEAQAPEYSENDLAGLQDGVDLWELIKGTDLGEGYTLDFSGLFNGENLTLTFSSNATTNGLIFDAMGEGLIGVQGTPIRSENEDDTDYTIKLTATDRAGLSTTVELELPEVQQAATPEPEPQHPLVGQTLYFIETPEGDDEVQLNYCETFHLEGGQVYFGSDSYNGDLTKSCAPVSDTASATYTIEGNVITIREDDYDPMTLEIKHTSTVGDNPRYIVNSVELDSGDDDYYSAFEALTNKAEAESRLNTVSTGTWENTAQLTTLFINGDYVELYITPQMRNNANDGEVADADLFIDNPNGDISCSDIQNSFDAGFFGEEWANFTEDNKCWTQTEDGKEYVSLDFDYSNEFTNPSTHRIQLMGLTDRVPSFNMNIQYVGDSAYD
jgi:hypothetical protein